MSPSLTAPLIQQPVPDTDWHAARVQLEQVLRSDPDNVEVLTHLGVLAARARQYRKARTTLERALAAAPQDLLARRLLVELLICFGDLDAARGWVTTGPTRCSGDPDWQAAMDAMAQLTPPPHDTRLDLKDVTFLIPLRADSGDRLRNLGIILRYLDEHLDTNILICEDDPGDPQFPALAAQLGELGARCGFFQAPPHPGGFIHRTRDLNLLAERATTPIVAAYDTDVLLLPAQYREGRAAIAAGKAMVLPYGGLFVDLERALVNRIDRTLRVDDIDLFAPRAKVISSFSQGGAVFYDRQALLDAGGYNENFVSWGFEAAEMVERFSKLGLGIDRVPGPLYHLTHARTGNSSDRHPFYERNRQELAAVQAMTASQIRQGVAAGRFRMR
jgi:N-terminal domain of galactosyltransferase/Tetratricopeptide repeat